MKEIVGQTKEFIKDLMISAFANYFPELNKLESFPFIARADILSGNCGIFWMWILPNGVTITYGKDYKHQFGITSQAKPAYLAEPGMIVKDSSLFSNTKVSVLTVDYINSGKIVKDNILLVEINDVSYHNSFGEDEFQHGCIHTTDIRLAKDNTYKMFD